jgi:hypothetical protein
LNFDGNFLRVGGANTQPIRAVVDTLDSADWESSAPPQNSGHAQQQLQTVPLVHDFELRHTIPARQPALLKFDRVIRPVLAITADYFDQSPKGKELTEQFGIGYFIRANLYRLCPGGTIAEERDKRFSPIHSHRIYAPIITNDKVVFSVGTETLHIPDGEIYEINNCRPHAARNDSDLACVYLVLDYVLRGEKCCCGDRLRPEVPCSAEVCRNTDLGITPCVCLPETSARS